MRILMFTSKRSVPCCLLLAAILLPAALSAQTFEEAQRQAQQVIEASRHKKNEAFEAYRNQRVAEFNTYRDRKNAEMAEYIRRAWIRMKGIEPTSKPVPQEQEVPPVVMPENAPEVPIRDKEIPVEIVPEPEPQPAPKPYTAPGPQPSPAPSPLTPNQTPTPDIPHPAPLPDVPQPEPQPAPDVVPDSPQPETLPLAPVVPQEPVAPQTHPTVDFVFYGTSCRVRFDAQNKPAMSDASEESVAQMWDALCNDACIPLYEDCFRLREELSLCDWAYYQLCGTLARTLYGADNHREAIVFQTVLLLQSGFDVMMGRDDAGRLYLLTASDEQIFDCVSFALAPDSSTRYYLLDGSNPDELAMMTGNLPELDKLRLRITQENRFASKLTQVRPLRSQCEPSVAASVRVNENLTAFYNNYPQAVVNTDPLTRWQFYAQGPASREMIETLYPSMLRATAGKGEREAVESLLHFVQTAFEYKLDDDVWGGDRPFFADETLYYPYCDCEDRSILFSRMVRDLLGLDVVLVYYPGHLAAAVGFNEEVKGDHIVVRGRKFVICDPTYIPAPVGKTMPGMDNAVAKAIIL